MFDEQAEAEPDIDAPETPEVDVPDESDAPPEVRGAFWSLVTVFNMAILAISVGAMFVGFQGRLRLGGGLMIAGALAFAVGVRRVGDVKDRLGQTTDPPADDAEGE